MICRKCGAENPVNAPFCSLCLNPLIGPSVRTEIWESAAAVIEPVAPVEEPRPATTPRKATSSFATRLYGIVGAEGMTVEQLKHELQNGGRIVRFRYTIGMILYSIKKDSPPYLIRAGKNAIAPGIKYSLLSFFLGWWGIPMGPLYTPAVIYSNFMGDTDITYEFTARMKSEDARAAVRSFNPYEALDPFGIQDLHTMQK